jgi:spermidine/putrescine transport system permease protein
MNKLFKEIVSDEFHFFMAMPAIAWQILFFYIPVALVIILSFVKTVQVPGTPIFTLEHYGYLIAPLFFWVIARSLVLALVTACLCLLLAYPVAYVLAVKVERYKNIFLFFLILPFWTSLMVQVYSWFFVLEHNGLLNTIFLKLGLISQPIHMLNTTFSIYLVMVYCYLPFMIFPLYTALEKIDKKMFEAAADLGASQLQTFAKITLPLSMPGAKTGFFLVFVPSFGEFVVPTLLGGGKQLFVGSLITQYFLSARNPYLGAAFTCLSGLVLLISIALLYWYFNRATGVRLQPKGQR